MRSRKADAPKDRPEEKEVRAPHDEWMDESLVSLDLRRDVNWSVSRWRRKKEEGRRKAGEEFKALDIQHPSKHSTKIRSKDGFRPCS